MPVTKPGGEEISYRIPNKNQCKKCHGLDGAVIPLGPKARNLSAEWLAGMVSDGRLDAMPPVHDTMPLREARGEGGDVASARAYTGVHFAHCPRPGETAPQSGPALRGGQGIGRAACRERGGQQ